MGRERGRSGGRRGAERGGEGRRSGVTLGQLAAGRAPTRPQLEDASYRQPEAVLLFLHGLQGGQSPEVLLHIGLLHLVIGRDQDLSGGEAWP